MYFAYNSSFYSVRPHSSFLPSFLPPLSFIFVLVALFGDWNTNHSWIDRHDAYYCNADTTPPYWVILFTVPPRGTLLL